MKLKNKNFRFIPLILLVFNFSSCEKYFQTKQVSSLEPSSVFNSVEYTHQAIMGIYQLETADEAYDKRLNMYYGVDNDLAICSGSDDNGRRNIAHYDANPGNTEIVKPWNTLYTGIERANICIKYIPQSPLFTGGTSDQKYNMRWMYGEALTLRALNYYELVRNWGDVPFPTAPSTTGEDFNFPKTDRDTIYDHILNDLKLAATLVPTQSQAGTDERVTKGAVFGLMARIALARGGYSLRAKNGGTIERDADYLKYYKIADEACDSVIQSGEHQLNPSFENVFKNMCAYQYDSKYEECMWEVGMGQGVSGEVGYYIGNKEDQNSKYGKANPGMLALPTYYYSFDSLDTRRDETIGIYSIDANNKQTMNNLSNITIAKWRREWMNPLYPGSNKYTGIDWILLRYSDILLMYAEAENELNHGPTAAATNALKQVRARAFAGNVDKMPVIHTTYEGFFNDIVQERGWEFGGECLRKFDLIRWNLLGTKIQETWDNLAKLAASEAPYQNVPQQIAWTNNGTDLVTMNMTTALDSATFIADTAAFNAKLGVTSQASSWAASITTDYQGRVAGQQYHSVDGVLQHELLPIPQSAIDQDNNLQNDYGY